MPFRAAHRHSGHDGTYSIGTVVELLSQEYDDVSLSKLRFLESSGLISPARTDSGYRRYSSYDIRRLRYILTSQRDYFLPNKVIREQLSQVDAGDITLTELEQRRMLMPSHVEEDNSPFEISSVRLTERTLCHQAEVEPEFIDTLLDAGVLAPSPAGFYSEDDVTLVQACAHLQQQGIDARHLRPFRHAIAHMATMVRQSTTQGTASVQSAEVRVRQRERVKESAEALVTVATAVLKDQLRDTLM